MSEAGSPLEAPCRSPRLKNEVVSAIADYRRAVALTTAAVAAAVLGAACPPAHPDAGSTDPCAVEERSIGEAIAAAGACDADLDCAPAFFGCPFGCEVAVRVDRQGALAARASGWASRCTHCEYKCILPVGGARCVDRRCTVTALGVLSAKDFSANAQPPPQMTPANNGVESDPQWIYVTDLESAKRGGLRDRSPAGGGKVRLGWTELKPGVTARLSSDKPLRFLFAAGGDPRWTSIGPPAVTFDGDRIQFRVRVVTATAEHVMNKAPGEPAPAVHDVPLLKVGVYHVSVNDRLMGDLHIGP